MSEDEARIFPANGFLPRAINEYEMAELQEMCSTPAWDLLERLFQMRADKYSTLALMLNQDQDIRDESIVRYNSCLSVINFKAL